MNLMEKNLIRNKNRKVNVSVKNKLNVVRLKRTMSGILVHMLVNVKHCEIDEYLEDSSTSKKFSIELVIDLILSDLAEYRMDQYYLTLICKDVQLS